MRTSFLFAAAACAATASAQIRLPFTRQSNLRSGDGGQTDATDERRSLSTLDLFNVDIAYVINVTVGTPPQNLSLWLSVQAGETWVTSSESCTSGYSTRRGCRKYGSFQSNASSTYVNPGTETFSTSYTDGYAYGEVMSETLRVGGFELPKLTMGLVESADMEGGVFALGFNSSGSSSSSSSNGLATVPDRLFRDGHINSTAYSLWIDDDTAASGNLLLGAIDKSKFDGPLIRFPTQGSSSSYLSTKYFDATLESVNGSKSSTDAMQPLGSLDSAYSSKPTVRIAPHSTTSWLPPDVAQDLFNLAGAVWNKAEGVYVVPCTTNTSTARIALQLHAADGPVLNVPISDLVTPEAVWSTEEWSWETESSTTYCLFGVQSYSSSSSSSKRARRSSSSTYSLGGNMLKKAYMVFDLANEEIAIAQTKFGSTAAEEIVPFPSYAAEVPESTAVRPSWCSASSPSKLCDPDGSGSGSSDADDEFYDYSYGLTRSAAIGIGVGVGAFVLIVIGLTIWAVMRCRRIRRAEAELAEKRADVEDGTQGTQVGAAGNGDEQEASLPQQQPAVVTPEPAAATATPGEQLSEKAGPARYQ